MFFLLLVSALCRVLVTAAGFDQRLLQQQQQQQLQQQQQQQQQLQQHRVKMYSMNRGLWTLPSTQTYLLYNFSQRDDSLTSFTACYWIREERFNSLCPHLSYAITDEESNFLLFGNDAGTTTNYVHGTVQVHASRAHSWHPEKWYHLCHLVNDLVTTTTYTLFLQGHVFGEGALEQPGSFTLNGTLIIGQEQDRLAGGFHREQVLHGDFAQLNIWDRALSASEVGDLATCRTSGKGNVFSMDEAIWEVFGDVQETLVDPQYFCRSSHRYQVLPEVRTFSQVLSLCQVFNSSLAVPASDEDNHLLHGELQPFLEACQPGSLYKFYIGITDQAEEGVWINANDQRLIEYNNFKASHPRGGRVHNCAHIFSDGYWSDTDCTTKLCGICRIERSEFLYLRGMCFSSEQEMYFHLDGYINNRPMFRGFFNLLLFWEEGARRWILQSIETNATLAWWSPLDRQEYPVGQHSWSTNDLCGALPGTPIMLSLSPCPHHMFICKSGFCLDQVHRCNFRYDCLDGSDEDDCGVAVLDSSYKRHLPPRGPKDSTLQLTPALTLTRIAGIDDIRMAVDLEFMVSSTWRDDRLNFNHLHPNTNTLIPEEEVQQIWTPKYQFGNLEGGQYKLLDKTVVVASSRLPGLPDFNSAKRDFIYPGASNDISVNHQYTARFTCEFDLYVYPFDVQICNIDIRLPWTYDGIVQFNVTNGSANYTGHRYLALYTVKNIRFDPESGPSRLNLIFELHRRQGLVLLSTFVPSVLLLLVSWATLFVNLEALNVRAIMSLTTLLVLYTLFSNLSSSMPNTAAIKLIDVWFFLIILLLFFNIMMHIFVEFLVIRVLKSGKKADKGINVTLMERKFQQEEMITDIAERIKMPLTERAFEREVTPIERVERIKILPTENAFEQAKLPSNRTERINVSPAKKAFEHKEDTRDMAERFKVSPAETTLEQEDIPTFKIKRINMSAKENVLEQETPTAKIERILSYYRTYVFLPAFATATVVLGLMIFLI